MQIDLVLKNKVLSFAEGSPKAWMVTDNADYQLHIDILDERQLAMFAVFVKGNEAIQCAIDEDGFVLDDQNERSVPLWAIDCPAMTVGVIGSGYASLPMKITSRGSVKRMYEAEPVQPDNPLIEQILAIVNSIDEKAASLPAVSDADNGKIAKVVDGAWTATPDSGGGIDFTTDETLILDENHVLRVNTTSTVAGDNTLPITAAGVYTQVGNINALLATI